MNPRYSNIYTDPMEFSFWLVFSADGGMKFSRGEPGVGRGERAMKCMAFLPKALFRTPELKATIAIGESVPSEFTIDVEAAGEALRAALGVDIDLRVSCDGE